MKKSIQAGLSKRTVCSLSSIALSCALLSPAAQAAVACTGLSVTSVSGTTPASGNLDLVGNLSFTCTRLGGVGGDTTTPTIYIGLNLGENPDGVGGTDREMTRQTGAQQVNYSIFRNAAYTGAWTSGAGRTAAQTNAGGLQRTITFSSAATTSQSFSFPYYFRVTQANWGAAAALAGIYDDLGLLATLRLNNSTGAVQSTGSFGVTMSKPKHCYFSSAPTNVALTYTAFSTSAQTGTSNFSLNCTAPTTYTMALDSTSGVLVGLRYQLALSNTGTITGTGFQQNHSVTVTLPSGQAGNCSGANCNGSQAHTITITY